MCVCVCVCVSLVLLRFGQRAALAGYIGERLLWVLGLLHGRAALVSGIGELHWWAALASCIGELLL